jgi:LAO/AO transport system kinase
MSSLLIDELLKNNTRSISRTITRIEEDDFPLELSSEIYKYTSHSIRLGITGPPGAGKSTITNQLINQCLLNQKSVGVVAVDPTSPFTGGALLGDRVRMNEHSWNDKVYIRSMGNHGKLGGLSKKAQEVGDVLAASGKDIIIFETVGVGQAEHDIISAADLSIVVLVPESGDEVQLMKAGIIEIGDIFVINKSDRLGANKLASKLKNTLHFFTKENMKEPEVYNTCATEGKGIIELYLGIQKYIKVMSENKLLEHRKFKRYEKRIIEIVNESLLKSFWTNKRINRLKELTSISNLDLMSPEKIAKKII